MECYQCLFLIGRRQTADEREAERQAINKFMLSIQSDNSVSGKSTGNATQPDPICLNNASLHALQNLQPWADDEENHSDAYGLDDARSDNDNDDDDADVDSDDVNEDEARCDVIDDPDDDISPRHAARLSSRHSISCSPTSAAITVRCNSTPDRRNIVLLQPYLAAA